MNFEISVPATSANLGPGFDSIGVAVSLYLKVRVLEETATWQVEHQMGPEIPTDEHNLIVKTALKLVPKLKPHHLQVTSQIPLARGLGSSSSAIVAGIELANGLQHLGLSADEKLQIAVQTEGHPDNVAPAILGDLVISSYNQVQQTAVSIKAHFPELGLLAFVPPVELLTAESRKALPQTLDFKTAVHASSIGNTLVAALLTNDLEKIGQLIEQDEFHEKFRAKLVPQLEQLRLLGHQAGAIGTYLSGAGPTVMTLIQVKQKAAFIQLIKESQLSGKLYDLKVARSGSTIKKINV